MKIAIANSLTKKKAAAAKPAVSKVTAKPAAVKPRSQKPAVTLKAKPKK